MLDGLKLALASTHRRCKISQCSITVPNYGHAARWTIQTWRPPCRERACRERAAHRRLVPTRHSVCNEGWSMPRWLRTITAAAASINSASPASAPRAAAARLSRRSRPRSPRPSRAMGRGRPGRRVRTPPPSTRPTSPSASRRRSRQRQRMLPPEPAGRKTLIARRGRRHCAAICLRTHGAHGPCVCQRRARVSAVREGARSRACTECPFNVPISSGRSKVFHCGTTRRDDRHAAVSGSAPQNRADCARHARVAHPQRAPRRPARR